MLTGLFMSCFLIGSLWFVIGIGDTLIYRDRMQEAADHGAFASAALHAKGMNFISLCNLILLVAVTIHIVLGIIHDIALALCIVSVGTTCGFWVEVRDCYTNYFDVLKPASRAIHTATKVASYGYPVMGLVEAVKLGKSYLKGRNGDDGTVLTLSPSLLSGVSFPNPLASKKEGMTLESRPMSLVCRRIASLAIDKLFTAALGVSGRGFSGKVINLAKTIVGDLVEDRYCNDMSNKERVSVSERVAKFIKEALDSIPYAKQANRVIKIVRGGNATNAGNNNSGSGTSTNNGTNTNTNNSQSQSQSQRAADPGFDPFWGEDGPMVVIGSAKNGNDWFQSYSVNLRPVLRDAAESFVGIGDGPKNSAGKYVKPVRQAIGYFAQAEFYFDCATKWSTEGCNFEGNSTFAIKWRARMRRFSIPSFSGLLSMVGSQLLSSVPQYEQFKRLQGQFNFAKDLFGQSGVIGMQSVRIFLGEAGKRAEGALTDAVRDQTKGAVQNLDIPFH
jgi:hypothetical protein